MLLSELAEKELIETENGIRYGFLADTECIFEPVTGKIIGFELPAHALQSVFQKKKASSALYIAWEEIVLIGEDRILFTKTATSLQQSE